VRTQDGGIDVESGASVQVVQATADKDPAVQQQALAAITPPSQDTANDLWRILVIGLLVLILVSLGGVLYLLADNKDKTSPDLALTAFTALLTGLFGSFVKSPTQNT